MKLQGWVKDSAKETVYCVKHHLPLRLFLNVNQMKVIWRLDFWTWPWWWMKERNYNFYYHTCTFRLYFNFVFFTVSQNSPCECVWWRLSMWQIKEEVMQCCSAPADTCPDWVCLSLWAVSTGCPWPVELEARGRRVRERGEGVRRVCEQDDNSASPARGAELTLSPSPRSLSYPSVAFKHSYAHACTNTQRQTLACPHKYP